MAVEQKVVIQVEIDPDMSKTAAVNAFLTKLDRQTKRTSNTLKVFDAGFKKFGVTLGKTTAKLMDFGKTLLKLNLKVFAVEIAAVTASMLAMKAALAVGTGFMKAWTNSVKFARAATAGLAAGITVLATSIAAAHRQFSTFQLAPFVGGLQQARTAMGGAMAAAPGFGQQAAQIGKILSQAGIAAGNVRGVVAQIADMSAGDTKAFQNLAQAVANVQKTGSSAAAVSALQGMGPQFQASAQQAGRMGGQEFIQALQSGALTPDAFKGSMQMLGNTVIGGMKEMISRLYVRLASMGAVFLDPIRNAMTEIEQIVFSALFRISGAIRAFGLETFIPGFVNMLAKFTDWMVLLINRDLPKLMGYFGAIRAWWGDFKDGTSNFFGSMGRGLRRYSAAAGQAWEMTKNFFGSLGGAFGNRMNMWREGMEQNGQAFQQFGTNLGDVVVAGLGIVGKLGDMFFQNLDKINSFLRFLADKVFPAIEGFAGVFVGAFIAALPIVEAIVGMLLPLVNAMSTAFGGIAGAGWGLGGVAMLGGTAAAGRGVIGKIPGMKKVPGAMAAGGGLLSRMGTGIMGNLRIAPKNVGNVMKFGGAAAGAVGAGALFGGGYLLNRGINSETATGGALQGAAGGALTGAAIGSVIPVVGTAAGAVIGGIVGGLWGGLSGKNKSNQMREAGKQLGKDMVDEIIDGFAGAAPDEMQAKVDGLRALLGDESRLDALAKEKNVSQEALTASLTREIKRLTGAMEIATNVWRTQQVRDATDYLKDYTSGSMISSYQEGLMFDAFSNLSTTKQANAYQAGQNTKPALRNLMTFLEGGGSIRSDEGAVLAKRAGEEVMQEHQNRGFGGTLLGDELIKTGQGMSAAMTAAGWKFNQSDMDIFTGGLESTGMAAREGFANSPLWMDMVKRGKTMLGSDWDGEGKLRAAYDASDPDMAIAVIAREVTSQAADAIAQLRDEASATAAELASLVAGLQAGYLNSAADVADAYATMEAYKLADLGLTNANGGNSAAAGIGVEYDASPKGRTSRNRAITGK